jgi:hypothetical protein
LRVSPWFGADLAKKRIKFDLRVWCSQNRCPPGNQIQGHAFAERALFAGYFCLLE